MAWTETDRDNLKAAIARGEKSVAYRDRTVVYRDLDEMVKALAMIEAELAAVAETPRPRTWLAYGSKGTG